jgi:lantibiotic biosynthesis protein
MKNYSFLKTVLLRTPIGEKNTLLTLEKIKFIFAQKINREALFLGSPDLYNALIDWEKGNVDISNEEQKSILLSLYKYASRLSNRCTPFGLFSTVAAIDIGSTSFLNSSQSTVGRYTKYDMHFLGQLVPIITQEQRIAEVLNYFPNNSMYTVNDTYRYVEYYYKKNHRFHKISEVEITEYLELVIEKTKNGLLKQEIVTSLISDDILEQDANEFVTTLIESQFLVSELEFTLTGADYLERLVTIFSQPRFNFYEAKVVLDLLLSFQQKIKVLDSNPQNDPTIYSEIHQYIESKIGKVDLNKLFQVDSVRKIENATLSHSVLKTIRPAITALNRLQSQYEKPELKEFIKRFYDRYEEYEQPLVKVLDPDIGIGYAHSSGAKAPLVDDLNVGSISKQEREIRMDAKKTFFLKKLIQSAQNGSKNIDLTDDEVNKFDENENLYPATFSVFLSVFTEQGKEKAHLKSAVGPSANQLIGRFGHLDTKILDLCNEVSAIESQLHSDKILAEIIHLPQARTGNILYRNFQRTHEIPYLGNSSLAKENQISIDDLYVSIKSNKIVLRSKKLNKEIIPRLGNAHNYSANALPIYHFLCDIQDQNTSGISFDWGSLSYDFDFLPRVTYKEVVLSRAKWNISKEQIEQLHSNKNSNALEVVRQFVKQRNIPSIVNFTQGDNEVVINFENDLSCEVFLSLIKNQRYVQLSEYLFQEESITENYSNEIVLTAHKNLIKNTEEKVISKQHDSAKIASYSIGEKWLYYKFYCGERAGEEVLNKAILPIVNELQSKKLITKWFYIRYNDSNGSHLRFRVLLKNNAMLPHCIKIIKQYTQPFEENQIIWKTQTDTYLPEIQRYGEKTIQDTETLFHNDSRCTLQFINLIEGDSGEKIRWLFALLSMDHLLNDFGYSLQEKLKIAKQAKTNFDNEFNRKAVLNKQVNEIYAKNEMDIDHFINPTTIEKDYKPIWKILEKRTIKNQSPIKRINQLIEKRELSININNLILSYLHMICNRIFLTKHRLHEMVVYDFLYKYYSKQLFVKNHQND